MPTLIIAEKNKAAQAIAEALGQTSKIREGKNLSVYTVPSKDIYVVPLRGHLLDYKNTKKYKSWSNTKPRDIIVDQNSIKKYAKSYASPYISMLKKYARKSTECIIGTDADPEGCNIGLCDALPYVTGENQNISISQIWLSSLQASEIKTKIQNRIPPRWDWAYSAEARSIIDAVIGFSATREVTNTLRPLLEKMNKKFISIGRVQTSLLYLIYLREERISDFKPEPYYNVEAKLNYKQNKFKGSHQSNPFRKSEKTNAEAIYNKIKHAKIAKVIKNYNNSKELKPPVPLNTSKALILITKTLKISADMAFKAMNDLYLNQLISYPRTDSDKYNQSFEHKKYLRDLSGNPVYGSYTSDLIINGRFNPNQGKKDAGDHPPITPIKSVDINSYKFDNNIQKRVYDILVRHYLALFSESAEESRTSLKLDIREEIFNSRFVSLLKEGFLEIAPFLKKKYDSEMIITENQIPIESVEFLEKSTKPPPKYTDTTLLKLMEKHNLGTKATRPIMINILQQRGLVSHAGRKYSITKLGKFLIDNLKKVWLPFLKPEFTKYIEDKLNEIKEKGKDMNGVVEEVKKEFLDLFDKFLQNKPKLIEEMNQTEIKPAKKKYKTTSAPCPHCGEEVMKLIKTRQNKRFLACSNENCSKKYLNLPNRGWISILPSLCSKCQFNIFKIKTKKNGKSFAYYICPNCWNKALGDKNESGFCSSCKNYTIKNDKCVPKEK